MRFLKDNFHWVIGVGACLAGLSFVWVVKPAGWMVETERAVGNLIERATVVSDREDGDRLVRVDRAKGEAQAALETRIANLDGFFENCKAGAVKFAASLTSFEASAEHSIGQFESLGYDVRWAFTGQNQPPDSERRFAQYVRRKFTENVVKPENIRAAAKIAAAAFEHDLSVVESGLAADLGANSLGDPGAPRQPLPDVSVSFDAEIARAMGDAEGAAAMFVFKFLANNLIGDGIAKATMPADADWKLRQGVGIGAGIAADMAIDRGLAALGYAPEREIASRVIASLDRCRDLIVYGDAARRTEGLRPRMQRIAAERLARFDSTPAAPHSEAGYLHRFADFARRVAADGKPAAEATARGVLDYSRKAFDLINETTRGILQ